MQTDLAELEATIAKLHRATEQLVATHAATRIEACDFDRLAGISDRATSYSCRIHTLAKRLAEGSR